MRINHLLAKIRKRDKEKKASSSVFFGGDNERIGMNTGRGTVYEKIKNG